MRRYRPLLVGVGVAAVLFAAFWELAEDFAYSPFVLGFDSVIATAIQQLRHPVMTWVMVVITVLGGTFAVTVGLAVLVVVLWRRGRSREAVYAAVVVAGGALLSALTKGLTGRARPPVAAALIELPASFSFPSGHTMGSLCLAWAVGHAIVGSPSIPARRKPGLVAIVALYPVLVGTSRVYLGVHWPSDVLASWLLSGAWIALATGAAVWYRGSAGHSAP